MEQPPIFTKVEKDLGMTFATLVSEPYEFEKHDAEVRRRIAAHHTAEAPADTAATESAQHG